MSRFIIRTLPVVSLELTIPTSLSKGTFLLLYVYVGTEKDVSFLFLFCPVVSCHNAPMKVQHLAQILSFFPLPYKSYSMLPIILRSSLATLYLASKETLK
jgi:hypothetical protein